MNPKTASIRFQFCQSPLRRIPRGEFAIQRLRNGFDDVRRQSSRTCPFRHRRLDIPNRPANPQTQFLAGFLLLHLRSQDRRHSRKACISTCPCHSSQPIIPITSAAESVADLSRCSCPTSCPTLSADLLVLLYSLHNSSVLIVYHLPVKLEELLQHSVLLICGEITHAWDEEVLVFPPDVLRIEIR